jgi:hypothetical protein
MNGICRDIIQAFVYRQADVGQYNVGKSTVLAMPGYTHGNDLGARLPHMIMWGSLAPVSDSQMLILQRDREERMRDYRGVHDAARADSLHTIWSMKNGLA